MTNIKIPLCAHCGIWWEMILTFHNLWAPLEDKINQRLHLLSFTMNSNYNVLCVTVSQKKKKKKKD